LSRGAKILGRRSYALGESQKTKGKKQKTKGSWQKCKAETTFAFCLVSESTLGLRAAARAENYHV
jgi:hypothetical protein